MSSRERILAAIDGKPMDRQAEMIWLEPHTALKIAKHLRPPKKWLTRSFFQTLDVLPSLVPKLEFKDGIGLLASGMLPEYQIELGADAVEMYWGAPDLWVKKLWVDKGRPMIKDRYGTVRSIKGIYMETADTPCKTPEDLERYEFPDVSNSSHYYHIKLFRNLHPDINIVASVPGVQDWTQHIYGMQRVYETIALKPAALKSFFQKLEEHSIQIINGALAAGADAVMILDDYGMQDRLLMSEKMWLEFTFPHLKRQIDAVHKAGGKAILHSCGYQMPLLKHYVEAGLDALQSFQLSAGNDIDAFAGEFGGKLCLFTGIDSQSIGRKSPDVVKREILRAVKVLQSTGRFVFCTTHALQVDTPVEILDVVLQTLAEVKSCRL